MLRKYKEGERSEEEATWGGRASRVTFPIAKVLLLFNLLLLVQFRDSKEGFQGREFIF